ncbi:MAG TPA: PDZ domain-containing protein, partial [Gemmatimonadaceae bacterium]|nr:PDZ domain-containing protein [Gemmatimonadaceae bacterium]
MGIRSSILLGAAAAALAAGAETSAAQTTAARAAAPRDARALLGLALGLSASDRDTLGVLVASVAPGGPAEQAGIVQGSRIAAVEGVSVRVDPEDVGRQESGEAVLRRLARTLQAVEPGAEVTMRVFADGRYQIVRVQTVAPRPPEPQAEELAWAATSEAPARRAAPAAQPATASAPVTLSSVVEALANLQTQLHRLSLDQENGALLDTLEAVDQELGALRRRLRAA